MKILKVIREDKCVTIRDEKPGDMSVENRTIEYHEAPLQSFDDALQSLKEVVTSILEVPKSWTETIKVKSLSISYTAKGTRSAAITFVRPMAITDSTHRMTTPVVRIDDPADGEEGQREVTSKHADLIATMIHEADQYARGERQQKLLPLDDPEDRAEPQTGDVLDFEEPVDGYHSDTSEETDGPAAKPTTKKKKGKKPEAEERTDWTGEVIPFHSDTDIPNFSKMEKAHAVWYINQTERAGLNQLKEEIRFNFGKDPAATTLAKLKAEAIKLLS